MLLDRANLRASLWAILYTLLLVVVSGAMVELGVSYFVVVPVALFVLPFVASAPFLVWLRPQ